MNQRVSAHHSETPLQIAKSPFEAIVMLFAAHIYLYIVEALRAMSLRMRIVQ